MKTTHFGYEEVPVAEKANKVKAVFEEVAGKYDIMNDVMSLGIHRVWKRIAISYLNLRPGLKILDLAGGTGDLSLLMNKQYPNLAITLADINAEMLKAGRKRVLNAGAFKQIQLAQVNAESMPFPDNHFDRAIMAFGLRNVTDKAAALKEIHRVLKPGGEALILEFSKIAEPLAPVYDAYSFKILPKMGKLIAGSEKSYRYLAESIRKHPDQETLKDMMATAGFHRTRFQNLSFGIAAMHQGVKL